jgi:hypothetical protein
MAKSPFNASGDQHLHHQLGRERNGTFFIIGHAPLFPTIYPNNATQFEMLLLNLL